MILCEEIEKYCKQITEVKLYYTID